MKIKKTNFKIMTDIGIIAAIISIIVGFLTIIAFFINRKWIFLFPRFRLKRKLKKYKKIRFDKEKEIKKTKEVFSLLKKAHKRFESKEFTYSIKSNGHGNIHVKGEYIIHLTPQSISGPNKFKISSISNPNEAYYSEGYPEAQKTNNNILALDHLIEAI